MTAAPREPKKTPLYEAHRRLGGKMVDFGGWWLPVQYERGILKEHEATRTAVGVFDVSHMGEIELRGPRAAEAVQRLVTNEVAKLTDSGALYTVACHPNGGIVDDLIVYRLAADDFLLVVNASNTEKDFRWFSQQVGGWCDVRDISDDVALIAFQGPRAEAALSTLASADLRPLRRFQFLPDVTVADRPARIARTGYTGEDGFEIFCSPRDAESVWDALVTAANKVGGSPVGLGARDTLRLEARLSLYGNDLSDETTPFEAGLGWVVKPDAGDFIGREALLRQQREGVARKLVGFVMLGRGIARHGYPIHSADSGGPGPQVGEVTSGTVGPTIGKNIGLGYVPAALAGPGTRLWIDCRGKQAEAEVVQGPFYRRASA